MNASKENLPRAGFKTASEGGQAHFAPKTPQNEPVPGSYETASKQPSRRTAIVAMFLVLVVAVFTVVAEQPEASAPSASAEEVAREILEIQNQLGGSIVQASARADDWLSPSTTPLASSPAPVAALREAAWQVAAAAHRLELVELYRQADALRELASQLRLDARRIQGARNIEREAKKTE